MLSERNSFLIQEAPVLNSYENSKDYYYEFSIGDHTFKEISADLGREIYKDRDGDFNEAERKRCVEISSNKLTLQKETREVYPGRYELGCF